MARIPVLTRDEMTAEGKQVHDAVMASTGRVGRGPSVGYAHAPGLWRLNNDSTAYQFAASLTAAQVRIVAVMTARRWDAPYPWSAQAAGALRAGVAIEAVEAINERRAPDFADATDAAVHACARELLETGTLGGTGFEAAVAALGHARIADIVGVIGHFTATALMANFVGDEPGADAPSTLKR